MKNDFELNIRYDKEMQELTITKGVYDTITYINIITFKDIINAINDYIIKERGIL